SAHRRQGGSLLSRRPLRYWLVQAPAAALRGTSPLLGHPDESDTGLMLQTILHAYAHQEKKRITERAQGGRKRRVRGEGRHGQHALMVGMSPKYGYRYADGEEERGKRLRYVIDEPAAQWVRWIFREYAGGTSLARIRARLDEMQGPTPSAYLHAQG